MKMKEVLSRKEQKEYLYDKIGNPVKFTYPEGDHLIGELMDRYVMFESEDDLVTYWFVIDLIKFVDYDEKWIRVSYYRYKKKQRKWVFAGQTSISNTINYLARLFAKAVKEKKWVRPLFKEVCKQCEKELNVVNV